MGEELAACAVRAPSLEDASYLVGRTYAGMLPDDFRSAYGVFYTPPAIVARLLDSAAVHGVDWKRCRALDPACGGGAFLGPLARRMLAPLRGADRRVIARHLSARLRGYEIDPFAAWISQAFLDATLHEELGLDPDESFDPIVIGDALSAERDEEGFDLIVANPPYGRLKLAPPLRARFGRSLFGHANLYGLFLDLAARKARPGGLIAYVTPTGFLSGEYFKRLRAMLAEEAPPLALDLITERAGVFDDVLQETLLAVFRRGGTERSTRISFLDTSSGAALRIATAGSVPLAKRADQPWLVPRTPRAIRLARRLGSMPGRLADWGYRVSTGPLVWNRFKGRLKQRAGSDTVPLIWAESVSADGSFVFRAARRNHAPFFSVEAGDEWLLVRSPCVLVQRTTAREQPRRLICAELPRAFLDASGGAVTVENHLNMVVPSVMTPPVGTQTLAAFLNSAAADRAFRCISGTVAVSAYELEAMPLPAPWALQGMSDLIAGSHTSAEVDAFCDRLYGER